MPAGAADHLDAIAASVPLFASALEMHKQGQIARARLAYMELLDQPRLVPVCLHQLGLLASQTGDHVRAIQFLHQAVQLDSSQPLYQHNLVAAIERTGQPAELVDALVMLAVTLQKAERHAEAIPVYDRALALDPYRYPAYANRGLAYAIGREGRKAVDNLVRAVALFAHLMPDARRFLDGILPELIAAGTVPAEAGISHAPSGKVEMLEETLVTLGKELYDLGHPDPALACYRFALSIAPGLVIAHWNISLALLWRGNFAEGWREYEWRWFWDRFPEPHRALPFPHWKGEPLDGKTIAVYTEQGYGDAIQFAALVPRLAARAKHVVFEVTTPLVRLFEHSFSSDTVTVIPRGDSPNRIDSPIPLDYAVALMSLPHRLGLELSDLPAATNYIAPLAADVAAWAERLAALGGLKVGIVWAGRPEFSDDLKRSIPAAELAPLREVPGVSWVSLQVGGQADAFREHFPGGFDAAPLIRDFADTAALIAALDLVVSVDTAAAHLAGAIGKPAWVLLPRMCDWRWLDTRTDTPWYPTLRLFRQPTIADWSTTIVNLANALREFAGADTAGSARGRL